MADSSNSSATGLQTTESQTTSTTNSTGNFSGGLGSSTVSPPSFSLGNDAGPGYSKGDLSFSANLGWVPNISANDSSSNGSTNMFSGATYNAKTGETTIDGNNNTSYSNNKSEPVMSVDEVYGKIGNQSIVESQGDYAASSNEKSNVETSTLGKQDNIAVTPKSVTENKGLVDNATIDSIEGLNFQQKDKESQDVMEAKKLRDDAEAEDKTNQMRDSLKAKIDLTVDEDVKNKFQIGQEAASKDAEKKFQLGSDLVGRVFSEKMIEASDAKKAYNDLLTQLNDKRGELNAASKNLSVANDAMNEMDITMKKYDIDYVNDVIEGDTVTLSNGPEIVSQYTYVGKDPDIKAAFDARNETIQNLIQADRTFVEKNSEWKKYKNEVDMARAKTEVLQYEISDIKETADRLRENIKGWAQDYEKGYISPEEYKKYIELLVQMEGAEALGLSTSDVLQLAGFSEDGTPPEIPEKPKKTTRATGVVRFDDPEQRSQIPAELQDFFSTIDTSKADEKTVQSMNDIATSIGQSRSDMQKAIAENNIPAYIEAQKQLNENYKAALEIGGTDFNKGFVTAVSKANDFEVTLPDGTKTSYSQFATDMATKSPEIAKAMYEAKAQELEAKNHPILAKIERAKAAMVETWFGSKLTMADNQVRNQFNQMAKTDMRATYAAYNNVLNDPNATPEQKAEASAAISQANGLMTASAALQASTGFLSGIGDSTKDGVYGTTDTEALKAHQKTLNTINNFAKIALGLGITPGANKAYQNMYYMAGAKVNESGLFSKDFDSDGLALCQEYGNNAAAGMIAGAGELATGVALFFNPATSGMALNLVADSVQTFMNGLYGVQNEAETAQKYTQEVLNYFKEAESIAAETGNEEALGVISSSITQIENFELKAGEVENLDNWLEGSGSNTAANEKFNQSLTYDEWLKLIEADPTMKEYAKKLIAEKKES